MDDGASFILEKTRRLSTTSVAYGTEVCNHGLTHHKTPDAADAETRQQTRKQFWAMMMQPTKVGVPTVDVARLLASLDAATIGVAPASAAPIAPVAATADTARAGAQLSSAARPPARGKTEGQGAVKRSTKTAAETKATPTKKVESSEERRETGKKKRGRRNGNKSIAAEACAIPAFHKATPVARWSSKDVQDFICAVVPKRQRPKQVRHVAGGRLVRMSSADLEEAFALDDAQAAQVFGALRTVLWKPFLACEHAKFRMLVKLVDMKSQDAQLDQYGTISSIFPDRIHSLRLESAMVLASVARVACRPLALRTAQWHQQRKTKAVRIAVGASPEERLERVFADLGISSAARAECRDLSEHLLQSEFCRLSRLAGHAGAKAVHGWYECGELKSDRHLDLALRLSLSRLPLSSELELVFCVFIETAEAGTILVSPPFRLARISGDAECDATGADRHKSAREKVGSEREQSVEDGTTQERPKIATRERVEDDDKSEVPRKTESLCHANQHEGAEASVSRKGMRKSDSQSISTASAAPLPRRADRPGLQKPNLPLSGTAVSSRKQAGPGGFEHSIRDEESTRLHLERRNQVQAVALQLSRALEPLRAATRAVRVADKAALLASAANLRARAEAVQDALESVQRRDGTNSRNACSEKSQKNGEDFAGLDSFAINELRRKHASIHQALALLTDKLSERRQVPET